jgi:hypothetical protein
VGSKPRAAWSSAKILLTAQLHVVARGCKERGARSTATKWNFRWFPWLFHRRQQQTACRLNACQSGPSFYHFVIALLGGFSGVGGGQFYGTGNMAAADGSGNRDPADTLLLRLAHAQVGWVKATAPCYLSFTIRCGTLRFATYFYIRYFPSSFFIAALIGAAASS